MTNAIVTSSIKRAEAERARQEREDREALQEIERLTSELAARPIRVRVEACPRSPSADGEGADGAHQAGEPPAYGILPERNSERLRIVIEEIEMLNAAYASCKQLLTGE